MGQTQIRREQILVEFGVETLTDGANITWDVEAYPMAKVTLADNRTLDNPTTMQAGATYVLFVISGTNTLSYGSAYKWSTSTAPVLSSGSGDVDILTFVCDGTYMYGVASLNFS